MGWADAEIEDFATVSPDDFDTLLEHGLIAARKVVLGVHRDSVHAEHWETMAVVAQGTTQLRLSVTGKTKGLCLAMCSNWTQPFSRCDVRRRRSCSECGAGVVHYHRRHARGP